MRKKNILITSLIASATILACSCANASTANAYNKQLFDTNYSFNKAVIDLHNEVITVDVARWTDYEDGEQLQIIAQDGTVYLTSSYNCTLINDGNR